MSYIFEFKDALNYDNWFDDPKHRESSRMERHLLEQLLPPASGSRILDIGCGTGRDLLFFLEKGWNVTGIDPSPYMLDVAKKRLGHRAELFRGFGEELPFDDNSFDDATLITSLEFVRDPAKVVEEACRVAKNRIFVGCLNKYAIKGVKRRIEGVFSQTVYNRARFFSVWELKALVKNVMGDVPLRWRTTCVFPETTEGRLSTLEQSPMIQRSPFGAYVAMVVLLNPRFRMRPISLEIKSRSSARKLAADTQGSMSKTDKGKMTDASSFIPKAS